MKNKGYVTFIILGLLLANTAMADEQQDKWQQMTGPDFLIYYRTDVPDDFVQTTMDTAEDELKRVTDNLGITNAPSWGGGREIKIYIYSNRNDYVKNGGQAGWSHGVAFAKAKTIKLYPDAQGFFDTLLPHELGHIVFRDYIGYTANIPLSQLTGVRLYKDSKDQVVDQFYAESASVVYYLITELDEQEFYMFCNELKNGTPFEEALHKVYLRFKTINDLNQAWMDYLQG